MTAPLLLLSTCGTSVLTNGAAEETRRWLVAIANKATLDDPEDRRRLENHVAERRERLQKVDATTRGRHSAELNGIRAVLAGWKADRVQHLLVHSDTAAGRASAAVVENTLEDDGHQVQPLTATGLRTDDAAAFREALAELTREIEKWVPTHREQGWITVFNLTGGFKSVNAYLQALGMLHADRCVFLFEGAPALMEIPRLPVRLADADEVREHLTTFRRLVLGYPVKANELAGLPDSLLLTDGDQVTTSVWGDVVWARVRDTLLAEKVMPPLSSKLSLDDAVRREFDKLQADRRVLVNEALDALSAHLDDVRPLLKSNTFKRLQGNPVPRATHEFYVWSDGGAWRIFGHFNGACFVADFLGPHL